MRLHHFRILDLRFDRKRQPQHAKALQGIQQLNDPTVEPIPSEKHCKRDILNTAGLQIISRDIPFLRCEADQRPVLLGSDFV